MLCGERSKQFKYFGNFRNAIGTSTKAVNFFFFFSKLLSLYVKSTDIFLLFQYFFQPSIMKKYRNQSRLIAHFVIRWYHVCEEEEEEERELALESQPGISS